MRKKLGVVDAIGLVFLSKLVWHGDHDIFFGDAGLGWHLRSGEWIAVNGTAPRNDPFLFLSGEAPWVHNQWLSDLLLWSGLRLAGLEFLLVVGIGVCLIPYLAVLGPLLSRGRYSVLAVLFAALIVLLTGAIQWLLRPVVLSFLFFALVYRICYRRWQEPGGFGPLYSVPVLMLLWVNLHPAFMLGWGLLAALGAAVLLRGFGVSTDNSLGANGELLHISVVSILAMLATLVNPYGLQLHYSMFSLVGSAFFMNLNREWLPPEFVNPAFWPFLLLFALLCISLISGARKRISIFEYLVVLGLALMSFQHRRYIPFFALGAFVPAVKTIDILLERLELPALKILRQREQQASCYFYSAFLWVLLLCWGVFHGGVPFLTEKVNDLSAIHPTKTVAKLAELPNRASGRVFNSPDIGGYLIWKTWPQKHIYIDDRNVLNGEERYLQYFAAVRAEPEGLAAFEAHQFEWAVVEAARPIAKYLREQSGWSLVNEDGTVLLFQRKDQ